MISVSQAYSDHLKQPTTNLATCVKITRQDGVIFAGTEFSSDLLVGGLMYKSSFSYAPSDLSGSSNLDVDNLEISGYLDSPTITESELMAGRWDYANFEFFEVIWSNIPAGTRPLSKGQLGEIKMGRTTFIAELRGMMQSLTRIVGELYQASCRYDLGDARCKFSLPTVTVTGSITAAIDQQNFIDTSKAQAVGWFDQGKITWTSGANIGLSMEVKTFTAGSTFKLALPMSYLIAVGDAYSIYPGCNKTGRTGNCKIKFNNYINFGGFEDVPGIDKLLRGPS